MTEAQLSHSLRDARALIDELIRATHSPMTSHMPAMREPRFRFGAVEVDPHYRRVTRDGVEVALTPREYELLVELARGNGAPVTIEHLVRTVWKGHMTRESRTIAQHVAEVRSKLELIPSRPDYLLTVRKVGYRLEGRWTAE